MLWGCKELLCSDNCMCDIWESNRALLLIYLSVGNMLWFLVLSCVPCPKKSKVCYHACDGGIWLGLHLFISLTCSTAFIYTAVPDPKGRRCWLVPHALKPSWHTLGLQKGTLLGCRPTKKILHQRMKWKLFPFLINCSYLSLLLLLLSSIYKCKENSGDCPTRAITAVTHFCTQTRTWALGGTSSSVLSEAEIVLVWALLEMQLASEHFMSISRRRFCSILQFTSVSQLFFK